MGAFGTDILDAKAQKCHQTIESFGYKKYLGMQSETRLIAWLYVQTVGKFTLYGSAS